MKSKLFLLGLICLVLVPIIYGAEVEREVNDVLNSENEVSVIVKLKDVDVPQTIKGLGVKSGKEQLELRAEKVREMQDKVISKLNYAEGKGLKARDKKELKLKRFSLTSGFAGKITKDELETLKNDPNVEAVYLDPVLSVGLHESLPQINGTITHEVVVNNTNITGVGETICVLDTGIDTDHTAFTGRIIDQYCYCSYSDHGSGGCCNDNTAEDNAAEDDEGHGTHCAGTAAGNHSTYRGIAPEAGIVSVKVCDNNGDCAGSDLILGIEWCTNHSSEYNISVMSISIGGGGPYNDYCDAGFAQSINAAFEEGILVAISAGNDGWTNGISIPACVENATPVSSVTKGDSISSFSNRGNILNIFAPGGTNAGTGACPTSNYICSAYIGGGFIGLSGTSMATPHVAGAAALLKQFVRIQNGTDLEPQVIEDVLNNTGKVIDDSSGSGRNYSRIDVYSAILSVDDFTLVVSFVAPTPPDNSYINDTFVFVNISSSESLSSAIVEFNDANTTMNGSGTNWYLNKTGLNGVYNCRVYGVDLAGNIGVSETRILHVNYTEPNITSYYPTDLTPVVTEGESQVFNVSYDYLTGETITVTWYNNGSAVSNNSYFTYVGNYSFNGTNISVVVSDGYANDSVDWLVSINRAPYFTNISNITANETDFVEITVSASDSDNDSLSYYYSTPFNTSGQWQTNYQSSGSHEVNVIVSDDITNVTETIIVTIIDLEDIDNDGVNDSLDSVTGNASSIITTTIIANVTVDNSTNLSKLYTGVQNVSIKDNNTELIEFSFNFSASNLSLLNVTINKNANGNAVVVSGINLVSMGLTKTIYLNNASNVNYVCVDDSEIALISDISAGCNGANEHFVQCNGVAQSGYTCSYNNTTNRYKITGLAHSGVQQQCQDADGDGYGTGCVAGTDCDDGDSSKTTDCGGGGTSGGSTTSSTGLVYKLTLSEEPSDRDLEVNDAIEFIFDAVWHRITLKEIASSSVKIFVRFMSYIQTIPVNQYTPIDLNLDGTDDVEVMPQIKLGNITTLHIKLSPIPTCDDGIKNQGELGTDCGGPCEPCPTVGSCDDGIKNQGETDVDCGGPCEPCPVAAEVEQPKLVVVEDSNVSEDGLLEEIEEKPIPVKLILTIIVSLVIVTAFIVALPRHKKPEKSEPVMDKIVQQNDEIKRLLKEVKYEKGSKQTKTEKENKPD